MKGWSALNSSGSCIGSISAEIATTNTESKQINWNTKLWDSIINVKNIQKNQN